jgi:phenylacetic acid degradation operon negative regulatory protein
VLGEFVLPQHAPVWSGALVDGLSELHVEEKAARQALSRLAAEGLLAPERLGRRVRLHLTASSTQLLTEGTARIYGFGRDVQAWDGRWLVVSLSVPESARQLRHLVRTRLAWAGLGSPMPGLWVTPDVGKEGEVAAVLESLGVTGFAFIGSYGTIGNLQQLVASSWHLDEIERTYAEFLKAFASNKTGTPNDAFRSQVRLVGQWRRVPFLDPGLPAELLPKTWPRHTAADLFHRRHDRWHARAQQHWRDLMAAAENRA